MSEFAEYRSGEAHKLLSDNRIRYQAQSILTGIDMLDHGPAPILPADQARDVVRWRYPAMALAA